MKKSTIITVAIVVVLFSLNYNTKEEAQILEQEPVEILEVVEQEAPVLTAEEFLKLEMKESGLTDRDFLILKEVIFCESSWSQFYKDGSVKVSNGNVGLTQINIGAHKKTTEKLGLDIYDEFDNLRYGVKLYKEQGLGPWRQWSGHCFIPRLAKLGINL